MAGPWEKFSKPQTEAGPWTKFGAAPAAAPSEPSWTDTAVDAAKSLGTGFVEGGLDLIGLPGTIKDAGNSLIHKGMEKAFGITAPQSRSWVSGDAFKGYMNDTTGGLHEPTTTTGDYSRTIGSFIPGAATMGGGSVLSNTLKYGVLPAVASETAGQATKGSDLEPYARAGAALATGGAAAALSRPSTAQGALREAARSIDGQTLGAAQILMNDARRAGVPLTLDEAVQQVTNNGTRLSAVRRVVDNSAGGADTMARFTAPRAGQVQAAGNRAIDAVGPMPAHPYEIGPRVNTAANDYINSARQTINGAADQHYAALAGQRMPQAEYAQISQNPSYQAALHDLRGNAELQPLVGNLPDDSLAVINEVVKRIDRNVEAVRPSAMNPQGADPQMAMLRTRARGAADTAARGVSQEYGMARDIVRQGNEGFLDPLRQGPVGQLAGTEDFGTQVRTVLPENPIPGGSRATSDALRAVSTRDPEAARALVSQRLRQVFNESTQSNMGGPNAWGGAKFASGIRGNSEQNQALREAINAVNGPGAAANFDRFLDVLEATGRRPNQGSMTEFNRQITDELKSGGLLSGSAATLASPTKLGTAAREAYENWRYGRNTEQLAALLTRQDAAEQLARIARLNPDSPQAQAIAAALIANTAQAGQPRLPAQSRP